jgi:hypothetical protein
VDLGPKVYDSTRIARMLGEDGSVKEARIDPRQEQAYAEEKQIDGSILKIYNLGVGIYDVDVETGPSYTTKRAEAAEAMIQLTQANPTMWQTHGDLIVAAQDWPNAQEFAKRSKIALPPPIAQAVQNEEQGGNPEAEAIKAQAQQMIDQLQGQVQQAQQIIGDLQKKAEDQQAKADVDRAKVAVEAYKARTERLQLIAPTLTPENVQAIVQQTVQAIMAQPAPAQDVATASPEMMEEEPPGMPTDDMMDNQPPPGGFFTPEGPQ